MDEGYELKRVYRLFYFSPKDELVPEEQVRDFIQHIQPDSFGVHMVLCPNSTHCDHFAFHLDSYHSGIKWLLTAMNS